MNHLLSVLEVVSGGVGVAGICFIAGFMRAVDRRLTRIETALSVKKILSQNDN